MSYSTPRRAATCLAACILLPGSLIDAQESGGLEARATLSFGVLYDDEDLSVQSGLGFALNSSTRTDSIGLSFNAALQAGQDDSADLVDPNLRLTYNRIGRDARFETVLSYLRSDIDELSFDDTASAEEVRTDTGTRDDASLDVSLEFGLQSPLGGAVDLGLRRVRYNDIDTLEDFDTDRLGASLRFALDPRIDLFTRARWERTEETDTPARRENTSLGIGAALEASQTMLVEIDLFHTRIERTLADGTDSEDEGLTWALAATQETRTGSFRYALSSQLTDDGTRIEARIGQEAALPRSAVEWFAGLSRGGDGRTDGIFGLTLGRETRAEQFRVELSRVVVADTFGDERLDNRVQVNYAYAVGETGRLQTGLSYRDTEFLDDAFDDQQRLQLSVGYRQAITRETDFVSELSRTQTWSGSEREDPTTTLFLGIERGFTWRP